MNRPNVGNNVNVNRPNIGINNTTNNNVNVNVGNQVRPGRPRPRGGSNTTIVNNITNINNTNITNTNIRNTNKVINVGRPSWNTGNPAWAYRPGVSYHQGWVNGYWHGQNNSNWWRNNGGAFFTGLAVGGIGAWGIGSAIYSWGYRPYVNPYAVMAPIVVQQPATVVVGQPPTVVVQQPAPVVVRETAAPVYDYTRPLVTNAPPPEPTVADPALQTFDTAREAFLAGDYAAALRGTDQALKTLSTDSVMHEFRALCLFALRQYNEAAGALYAVLSAGPGWDWTTLSSLYPNVDVYSAQVQALEDYRSEHPDAAAARFVLGYHYLTQGHTEAALGELREVVKLQPQDRLAAQLVSQLSGDDGKGTGTVAAQPGTPAPPATQRSPAPAPPAPTHAPEWSLVGVWKASPEKDTTIELTSGEDGSFRWNVIQRGQSQPIEGKFTYADGVLTLSQSDTNSLVGKIEWQDERHFRFQAMGGGAGDPGLLFSR